MSEDIGRREAHKRATRAAIKAAAMRLVAEQGFEATTVRQIADAAEVTERTFYRYFDGKTGLVADEALSWMERLHREIRNRPSEEPPLQAVARAMVALAAEIRQNPETAPLWMFADTPQQHEMLQRSAPRPLLRGAARNRERVAVDAAQRVVADRRCDQRDQPTADHPPPMPRRPSPEFLDHHRPVLLKTVRSDRIR